jgi:mannose-1-phosphate guanylyltransferase
MEIPSISVDYAVMEKTSKIKVVNSDFGWSDMGSFEAIYDFLIKNGHPIDEKGNMVIGTDTHCEFVGLRDTILVHTHDALLLLQKENAQQVKKVFEKLELEKPDLTN